MPKRYEKLRYQPNRVSQWLIMGGMIFMVIALFSVINVYRYTTLTTAGIILPNIWVGIEILVAIFVMLISFLLGEKYKTYDKSWHWVGFALTAYSLIKIFIFPIILYNKFLDMIADGEIIKYKPKQWLALVIICLVVSAALYLAGTLLSIKKTGQLGKYYEELSLEDEE
ncbi:MAG: hypothetical protein ACOX56_00070 [Acholeplasmataceae bacterium]|jgi:hypothetical protein